MIVKRYHLDREIKWQNPFGGAQNSTKGVSMRNEVQTNIILYWRIEF